MLTCTREVDAGADNRSLGAYLGARLLSESATLMLSVAVGWDLYRLSRAPLALGLVGLAQFAPIVLFFLPQGELCDRRGPRGLFALGLAIQGACCLLLAPVLSAASPALGAVYLIMVFFGLGRILSDTVGQALLPRILSPARLPSAIAWDGSFSQATVIAGPALGVRRPATPPAAALTVRMRLERVLEGIRFIRSAPALLGAISLNLMAVLLGGATVLLPVFARDVLQLGAQSGLVAALLRTVPAVLLGGLGTLAVAAIWRKIFPALAAIDDLPRTASGHL